MKIKQVFPSSRSGSVFALRRRALCGALALSLGLMSAVPAAAREPNPSEASGAASGLSVMLPVAVSMTGTALVLSAGATLTVVAVQATAYGTVWVLQRASDGARLSVRWSADGAKAASMVAGTVLSVAANSAGWLLVSGSEVMAFIPNELGASLIHHEQMTY